MTKIRLTSRLWKTRRHAQCSRTCVRLHRGVPRLHGTQLGTPHRPLVSCGPDAPAQPHISRKMRPASTHVSYEAARRRLRDTYLPVHPVFTASLPATQAQPTLPSRSLCMKRRQLKPHPQCGSQVLAKQPSMPSSGHTLHQAQLRVSTTIPLRACGPPYAACNFRTTCTTPLPTPCFKVWSNAPS